MVRFLTSRKFFQNDRELSSLGHNPGMTYRFGFLLLCLGCYLCLISLFSLYALADLSWVQGLVLIARESFFEFIIAYHLYEAIRIGLLRRFERRKLWAFLSFGPVIIFLLNLLLIQLIHSFLGPVPLSITLTVFHSIYLLLPWQLSMGMLVTIMLFSAIYLVQNGYKQAELKSLNS